MHSWTGGSTPKRSRFSDNVYLFANRAYAKKTGVSRTSRCEERMSHIWRIDADASGAWCSVATPTPGCSVYKSGFTAIEDIAFSKTGELYVLELASDGVFAFEAGLDTGQFPPAVLLDVKGKHTTELAAGQLSQPGGVAVSRDNKVYVTDGVFTDGRLLRVS